MFWSKKKPFTVRVCWRDGKEENFPDVISWAWQTTYVLRIRFEEKTGKEDLFFPVSQIKWFSGKD